MRPVLLLLTALLFDATAGAAQPTDRPAVLLVLGAPGEPEFGSNFLHQASLWQQACTDCRCLTVGLESTNGTTDFDRLKSLINAESKEGLDPLWIVLIGHGTFDGKEARFNLRGPDLTAGDLAQWLQPFRRPLVVINTASASAPFLKPLAGTNRVVITATRSGYEQNFAHFGQYFAEALTDPQADLDKDGQISVLEAFLTASRRVADFYKADGRLATEHALLDDNGDGLGTPMDWFKGLRAIKKAQGGASVDGLLAGQFHLVPSPSERNLTAEQRARRDSLERAVLLFREKKNQMSPDDYYRQLEQRLLELARFYASIGGLPK
ncbi:MAG TPA: hypothetical protein VG146_10680 [Verrucomicrobiae bacterium]|nr:hypothetical protein [Verrucomicrobiae bacterium]